MITTHIPAGSRSIKLRQVFWLVRCRAFPISKISGKECVQHSSFLCACGCERNRRQGWDLQQLVLSRILTEFPFHRLWCCNHARLLMHCKYRDYFDTNYKSTGIFLSLAETPKRLFFIKNKKITHKTESQTLAKNLQKCIVFFSALYYVNVWFVAVYNVVNEQFNVVLCEFRHFPTLPLQCG